MKLLSAEVSVIWKPMIQSIWYTWYNLLAKADIFFDKTRIMVMECRKDEPCLWNSNAGELNYTKK